MKEDPEVQINVGPNLDNDKIKKDNKNNKRDNNLQKDNSEIKIDTSFKKKNEDVEDLEYYEIENIRKLEEQHQLKRRELLKQLKPMVVDTMKKVPDKVEKYDEFYSFFHHQTVNQRLEFIHKPKPNEIINKSKVINVDLQRGGVPFLPTCEFFYDKRSSIHNDLNMNKTKLSQDELKEIIKNRISVFKKSFTPRYATTLFCNIPEYIKILSLNEFAYEFLRPIVQVMIELNDELINLLLKALLSIIPKIVEKDKETGEKFVKDHILPIIFFVFVSPYFSTIKIKNIIFNLMICICHKLKCQTCTTIILNKIMENSNKGLFQDKVRGENLIVMVRLFNYLLADYEEEYNESIILPKIQLLSGDKNRYIKKEVCKILPVLSHHITYEANVEKLRPIYELLCNDNDSLIRVESVYILPLLMKENKEKSEFREDNTYFVKIFQKFMLDNNRNVRLALLESFGKFIIDLDLDEVDTKLLEFYTDNIHEYYFNSQSEYDFGVDKNEDAFYDRIALFRELNSQPEISNSNKRVAYSTAFNFPAMLFRFGKENWNMFKFAYMRLISDDDENVVRSMINSFTQISRLLGEEITKRDLLPLYDNLLNNEKMSIRTMAINNLANYLTVVDKNMRKNYRKHVSEGLLSNIIGTEAYIRSIDGMLVFESHIEKISTLDKISLFFDIYENDFIYRIFLRLSIILCFDKIDCVRQKSAEVLSKILIYFYNNDYKKELIEKILDAFASCQKYKQRMVFCYLCRGLMADKNIFNDIIYNKILKLYYDDIINVRISFATLLNSIINQEYSYLNYLQNEAKFYSLIKIVQNNEELNEFFFVKDNDIYNEWINKEEVDNLYQKLKELKINVDEHDNKLMVLLKRELRLGLSIFEVHKEVQNQIVENNNILNNKIDVKDNNKINMINIVDKGKNNGDNQINENEDNKELNDKDDSKDENKNFQDDDEDELDNVDDNIHSDL